MIEGGRPERGPARVRRCLLIGMPMHERTASALSPAWLTPSPRFLGNSSRYEAG